MKNAYSDRGTKRPAERPFVGHLYLKPRTKFVAQIMSMMINTQTAETQRHTPPER